MRALEETLRAYKLGAQNERFVTGGWWDIWAKLRTLDSTLDNHKLDIEKLKGVKEQDDLVAGVAQLIQNMHHTVGPTTATATARQILQLLKESK